MRKTFHDGPRELRDAQAQQEFTRLERFSAALAEVPGAACPRPLELLVGSPGLRMEHAAGVDLSSFFHRQRLDEATRERIADTMAAAIGVYVRTMDEPLPDFNFGNVLYDPPADMLTFVDFGAPQDAVAAEHALSHYESTVGDLLGSVVFQSARPRYALRRGQHAESVAMAAAVLRALRAAGDEPLRDEELTRAARAAYRRCAFGRNARRDAWYATAGYVLGRRVPLGQITFGPLPPWSVR